MRLMPDPDREAGPGRNLYVKKSDVEGNHTPGCPGCHAIMVGLPARPHSNESRTLVQQRLLQTQEGRQRLKAQKRKGEAPAEGEAQQEMVLDERPNIAEEEVAEPAAIGQPEGRVEPMVRPIPEGRPLEDAGDQERSLKRAKSPERRARKREGDAAGKDSCRMSEKR